MLDGVPHGFLTRSAGVSTAAAAAVLPEAQLVTIHQIHSADCVTASAPWPEAERPHADALVTDRRGLLLGIVTADCAPVLLADREAGVVGAAHAGWKGALGGVTAATIAAMEALGAQRSRIVAAVGPCIAQPSYEVDTAFRDRFGPDTAMFFAPGAPEHWQFDLAGYVAHRLAAAGIGTVERLGLDTYADDARFYSFRRATHRGEADCGRQISLIGLA